MQPLTRLIRPNFFSWVMIVSLALQAGCNLPTLPLPKTVPTHTPVPILLPTSQPPLPPSLLETNPVDGAELAPSDPLMLYFNQVMDKASVEAALQVQPAGILKLEWPDGASLRLSPSAALPAGSELKMILGVGAKSAQGLPLDGEVRLAWRVSPALALTTQLPAPGSKEVDPTSAVVAAFNEPVVALNADPTSYPPAFSLEPAAVGRGMWLNTSTYIFYPQNVLQGGVVYTVKLNSQLVSARGTGLGQASQTPLSWSFTTAKPKMTTLDPGNSVLLPLDQKFMLKFNQTMDQRSVEDAFSLVLGDGRPISGEFAWDKTATSFTFTPKDLLPANNALSLILLGGARAVSGASLGTDLLQSYTTVSKFTIRALDPAQGSNLPITGGNASLTVTFTSPLADQDLSSLIVITPAANSVNYFASGDNSVVISGNFLPTTAYKLVLSGDLKNRWGESLGAPQTYTFTTSAEKPSLSIPILNSGQPSAFVLPSTPLLTAQVTNLTILNISQNSLPLDQYLLLSRDYQARTNFNPAPDRTWQQTLHLKPNTNITVNVPLIPSGASLPTGLYYYTFDSPGLTRDNKQLTSMLAVVSRVHLTLKTSARQMLVWAVRLPENTPLGNAVVTVLDANGVSIVTGTTDAQGLAQMDLPARADAYETLYASIGKPGDSDFALANTGWDNGKSGWSFNLRTDLNQDHLFAYLYTDRPIYRPGDTVHFRAVVRNRENGRYLAADLKQLHIKALGEYDAVKGENPLLTTLSLGVSDYGTAEGTFQIPANAPVGTYSLEPVEVPDGRIYYQVADYRKPEVDLQVQFKDAEVLAGGGLTGKVTANYYFGAAVDGLKLHWTLYARTDYFVMSEGYQTGKIDFGWTRASLLRFDSSLGRYVTEGDAVTDAAGNAQIIIPADKLAKDSDLNSMQHLELEVTVQDQSEIPTTVRAGLNLYPAKYFAGVRSASWMVPAGSEAGFDVLTVDWQNAISGDHKLSAVFSKITWHEEQDPGPFGQRRTVPEFSQVSSVDFRTDIAGRARLAFTPKDAGMYQLQVSGEGGALTQVLVWVGGTGAAAWPSLPDNHIQLTADASLYQPGQNAHVLIPNPFAGRVLALITVERAKVMRSQVVYIQDSSMNLELPLSAEDAPNVYVSVTLLGARSDGTPDFRVGYQELKVNPSDQTLQVNLTPNPAASAPGGKVNFTVQVRDSQGKPVQGEFSLALVDKAVLALADANTTGIVDAFYAPQPLGVRSSLALAASTLRYLPVPVGGGGGGGAMVVPPSLREDFRDTAFWNGSFTTDADGKAELNLTLPDNLTTWVATVRGLTKSAQVGEAVVDLTSNKPLMIIPTLPRFVVAGDRVQLAATVHNNTGADQQVQVSLQASGVKLDAATPAEVSLAVPNGGLQRITWFVDVESTDKLDLIFSAKAGNFTDAARPEGGSLTVLRYSVPQSFATAGVLAKAGSRTEVVSLPRSFMPNGGSLRLEVTPSLAATILSSLTSLQSYPGQGSEATVSHLLPNLEIYQILTDLPGDDPLLRVQLKESTLSGVSSLAESQNQDGGWSWSKGQTSDAYLSAYALYGLARAQQAGLSIPANVLQRSQQYLAAGLVAPQATQKDGELNRLVFEVYALRLSGWKADVANLFENRARLAPWAQAMLAMILNDAGQTVQVNTLLSDLESSAQRSASGAFWGSPGVEDAFTFTTQNYSTALVVIALTHLKADSALLPDAVRYLVSHRRAGGAWASTFESAWVLTSLAGYLKSSGDLQAEYTYQLSLNGRQVGQGQVGRDTLLQTITTDLPLSSLSTEQPNSVNITRSDGAGNLYYRAFLELFTPVESAVPLQRGISLTRNYFLDGQDCRLTACQPLTSYTLGEQTQLVIVHLTLTISQPMAFLAVEDATPAGAEIVNLKLINSAQGQGIIPFNSADPFGAGWGNWLFSQPQIQNGKIRWVAENLAVGTYDLTYRITPLFVGVFHVLPARAYQVYFPDVEGTTGGATFSIK